MNKRVHPLTDYGKAARIRMLERNIQIADLAKAVNERLGTAIDSGYINNIFCGRKAFSNKRSKVKECINEILEMEVVG